MTAAEVKQVIDLEDRLAPGFLVEARWTNNGHFYRALAHVVRRNGSSIRVRLLNDHVGYKAGHEIVVPRLGAFTRWSLNNGAFPASTTT